MKKLMIAAGAIALAAAVQAAQYNWAGAATIKYGDTTSTDYVGGTLYVMRGGASDVATFANTMLGAGADYATTFATLVASAENYGVYAADPTWALTSANKGTPDTGVGGYTWDTTDTVGSKNDFYQVLLDTANNAFYVSEVVNIQVDNVGASVIGINNISESTFGTDVTEYTTSGWYTVNTESTPEPTSAMLMLLGVAGLALKRKRA